MANRRVLIKRRKAARNIRKITRTMQLIATARFQSAYNAAVASRPYTDKLAELVRSLASAAGDVEHPLMAVPEEEKRTAVVVLTSNRGLCGGYNANLLREAIGHLEGLAGRGVAPEVHMVGKKGASYFRFLGREMSAELTEFGDQPRFDQVEPMGPTHTVLVDGLQHVLLDRPPAAGGRARAAALGRARRRGGGRRGRSR